MRELPKAEKRIARRAYEKGREAVLAKTLAEFKAKAAAATTIEDMWSLVDDSRSVGRELDNLLEYRNWKLTLILARLIFEGYLDERELAGLSEETLEEVHRHLSSLRWVLSAREKGRQ